jgi:hypothetical protein
VKKGIALAATALALLTATPAEAAVVVQDYTFTASTPGAPTTSHSGSFSLGFDDVANTYSLLGINFSIGSTVFDLTNTGVAIGTGDGSFVLGGTVNGVGGIGANTDDFWIRYNYPFNNTIIVTDFLYSEVGFNDIVGAADDAFTITAVSGVPEPATWAMLLLGFGAVGLAMRRRKQTELTFRRAA